MNVIVLHGSPNRDGNSDTLVKHFINGLESRGLNEIKQFILYDMSIKPCQGCRSCNYSEDNACIIEDDMQNIYSAFEDVDIVVFATPMYWGYMTAQMKLAIDRMEALAMNPDKYWVDKAFIGIFTYNYHVESMVSFFKRIQEYFRFRFYPLIYCSLDEVTEKEVHVSERPDKLEEAYQLGKKLGKAG